MGVIIKSVISKKLLVYTLLQAHTHSFRMGRMQTQALDTPRQISRQKLAHYVARFRRTANSRYKNGDGRKEVYVSANIDFFPLISFLITRICGSGEHVWSALSSIIFRYVCATSKDANMTGHGRVDRFSPLSASSASTMAARCHNQRGFCIDTFLIE